MSSGCKDQRVEDLRVLYDFEYQTKDDRTITISEGEKLFLIAKTNADWWQVIRSSRERPFFVPAQYVEAADDGQRILSDRRKSWAVEELLLELTRRHPQPEPEPDYDVDTDNSILSRSKDKIVGAAVSSDDCAKTKTVDRSRIETQPRYNRVSVHLACINDFNGNLDEPNLLGGHNGDGNVKISEASDAPAEGVRVLQVNNRKSSAQCEDGNCNVTSGTSATVRVQPSVLSVSNDPSDSAGIKSPRSRVSVHLERIGSGDLGRTEFRAKQDQTENETTSAASPSEPICAEDRLVSKETSTQSVAKDLTSRTSFSQPASPEVFERECPFQLESGNVDRKKAEIASLDRHLGKGGPNLTRNAEFVCPGKANHAVSAAVAPRNRSRSTEETLSPAAESVSKSQRPEAVARPRKGSYARVSISPEIPKPSRRGPKVAQLSESLERLAQQIQFGAAPAPEAPPPQDMFLDVKQRLTHSRSFKSTKELERMRAPEPPVPAPRAALGFRNPAFHRSADDLLALPTELTTTLPAPRPKKPSRWGVVREAALSGKVQLTKGGSDLKEETTVVPPTEQPKREAAPSDKVHSTKSGSDSFEETLTVPIVWPKDDVKLPVVTPRVVLNENQRFSASSGSRSSLDELVSAFEARSRSGSNTSDDAVLEPRRSKTSLARANRVQQLYKNVTECEEVDTGLPVPAGWTQSVDPESGLPCFVHPATGDKWFSSSDAEGRVYFFEENSPSSSWALPSLAPPSPPAKPQRATPIIARKDSNKGSAKEKEIKKNSAKDSGSKDSGSKDGSLKDNGSKDGSSENSKESRKESLKELKEASKKSVGRDLTKDKVLVGGKPSMASIASLLLAERRGGGGASNRAGKTMSMILPSTSFPEEKSPTGPPPIWPQLDNNTMRVIREGFLQRARVLDQGRKVRKAWGPAYVVLTELLLLFFPDQKQAHALLSGPVPASTAPELCVPLSGATVTRCDRAASSRKHALNVTAALDVCAVLIQCDSAHSAECWEHDLQTVIQLLPRNEPAPVPAQSPSVGKKSSSKVQRSKSMKLKGVTGLREAAGSVEDLTAAADSEDRHRIRARLRKFFVRRPTREALVKKGIYKDEPMFGRLLSDVTLPGQPAPAFVMRCIERIESRRENMEADGLYRVSGNLSQVQRIRLAADQNDLGPLDSEEDVHVITGALKLFFRELKQPLIPCQLYVQSLHACSEPSRAERLRQFASVVKALPAANRSTLRYLLAHLLRVSASANANRMHVANVAIVFGPTLMWSLDVTSTHMATELMQQNLVVEHLLLNYDTLF